MKTTFTILLAFIFSNVLRAQSYGSSLVEQWRDSSWKIMYKSDVVYDANGDVTTYIFKQYNAANNSWKNSSQMDYTYRPDRKISISTAQIWDTLTNNWSRLDTFYYLYDNTGKLMSYTSRYNTNGIWKNVAQMNYVYDTSGYMVKKSYDVWNDTSSAWKNEWYELYTNNENGTVKQYVEQNWRGPGNTLKNGTRYNFTYEPGSFKPSVEIREGYFNEIWNANTRILRIYTNVVDSALWQGNENVGWVNSSLVLNRYNNEGKESVREFFNWNRELNAWDNNLRETYTYNLSSGISEVSKPLFGFYPNPTKDLLTLKLEKTGQSVMRITDMQGKLVSVKQFTGQQYNVDLSDLLPAVYVISVEQNGARQVSRFVKL